jgi:hypothetical protein
MHLSYHAHVIRVMEWDTACSRWAESQQTAVICSDRTVSHLGELGYDRDVGRIPVHCTALHSRTERVRAVPISFIPVDWMPAGTAAAVAAGSDGGVLTSLIIASYHLIGCCSVTQGPPPVPVLSVWRHDLHQTPYHSPLARHPQPQRSLCRSGS